MKHFLLALLLLLTVSACLPKKGDKDPEPDLAGTYQVSQITNGSTTLNLPDGSGNSAAAIVTRSSDTQISVTVNVTESGSTTPVNYGTLGIRKASGKDYDVLNPSTSARIGLINGTDFNLDFTSNGQRFALISRK